MADKIMEITIRKAKPEDAKAIADLHKKIVSEVNSKYYSAEAIKEWLGEISAKNVKQQFKNSSWIVAEIDGKLVGFGQYSITAGEVYQINVDPDFLKQNIGKRLYDYMENEFISKGIERIGLNSTLNALGFYQKLGFRIVGKNYIGLVKLMKMEKSLR